MHTTSCSPTTFARGVVVVVGQTPWRDLGRDLFRFVLFVMTIMGGIGVELLATSLFVTTDGPVVGTGPAGTVVLFACLVCIPVFLAWAATCAYAAVRALCALGQDASHA